MNKQEAAEFLGIGVRSLERYMSQGRIAYTRQRGKTGEVVVFEDSELQRFNPHSAPTTVTPQRNGYI